jgi:hypothetical protein
MKVVKTDPAPIPDDVAAYISDMADELCRLAQDRNMVFLAYLLAMAASQARAEAMKAGPAPETVALRIVPHLAQHG